MQDFTNNSKVEIVHAQQLTQTQFNQVRKSQIQPTLETITRDDIELPELSESNDLSARQDKRNHLQNVKIEATNLSTYQTLKQ